MEFPWGDQGLQSMSFLGTESAEDARKGSCPLDEEEELVKTLIPLHGVKPDTICCPLSIKPDPQYKLVRGVLRPTGAYYNWLL